MAKSRITVKEYLAALVERSQNVPALKNFLREHDFVGTIRGTPHWRRNVKFFERNAHV